MAIVMGMPMAKGENWNSAYPIGSKVARKGCRDRKNMLVIFRPTRKAGYHCNAG